MFFVFLNGCQSADSNLFMFRSSKVERKLSVFISVGSQILLQSLYWWVKSSRAYTTWLSPTCLIVSKFYFRWLVFLDRAQNIPFPFDRLPGRLSFRTKNTSYLTQKKLRDNYTWGIIIGNYLRLGRHGRNLSLTLIHDFGIMNINTQSLCTIIVVYYYELRFISHLPQRCHIVPNFVPVILCNYR